MKAISWCTTAAAIALTFALPGFMRLSADDLPPPPDLEGVEAEADANVDVLLRGPVHEAFAEQINLDPQPGLVVDRQPPELIEEIPPEVRPEGDHATWIPGYWGWEEERDDFIWISGVWRTPPPGHRWVPGYWTEASAGYQWVSGFWLSADVGEVEYLPYPPESMERGPTGDPPSEDHVWVSGSWVHEEGRYQWQPGYWTQGHDNWMWIPSRYAWTPRGAVFVRGRWDHRLSGRGMLFAPVHFRGDAASQTSLRLTPSTLVNAQQMMLHMFVRPDHGHYYYGDYYGEQYAEAGFHPVFQFNDGRRQVDPLFGYYRWYFGRQGTDYAERLTGWHRYFQRHEDLRPPRTLADQVDFLTRHEGHAHAAQALLGNTVSDVLSQPDAFPGVMRLADAQRQSLGQTVSDLTGLAGQRLEVEAEASARASAEAGVNGALELPGAALRVPEATNIVPRNLAPTLPDVLQDRGGRTPAGQARDVLPTRPRVPDVQRQVPRELPVPRVPRVPSVPSVPRLPGIP
jgi:hypothetical protein